LNISKNRNTGKAEIALTFYYHAQFFNEKLNPLCEPVKIMSMWLESSASFDVNGDKIDDLLAHDIYGRSYCINGANYKASKLFWSVNGISSGILPLDRVSNGRRLVLYAGMNKLKAMSVSLNEKPTLLWEFSNNDLYSDVLVEGKESRIIAGKTAGNVMELSKDGKLIRNIPVDGIVHSLAPAGKHIAVGTSKGLVVFDNNWNKIAFHPGDVTKVIQINGDLFLVANNALIKLAIENEKVN
jgi:hypothetical protein